MKTSESIDKIAAAIAAVQKETPQLIADKLNPFFKSQYADLSSVIKCLQNHLIDNDLIVIQGGGNHVDNCIQVTSRVVHSSGQWIESSITVPLGGKKDAQSTGSALTYGRRYLTAAQFNLAAAEDDDDGNAASTPDNKDRRDTAALTAITDKQIKDAGEFFKALKAGDEKVKATVKKYTSNRTQILDDMMKPEAATMITALNKIHCEQFAIT